MKWISCIALLGMLLLTSCAATFTIRGTAPTMDNAGTCAAPNLIPTLGGLVRVRLTWTGPQTGADSVIVAPGTPFTISRNVPAGTYTFTAVCADSLGNVSLCPTSITKLVRGSFADIQDLR